MIYAAILGMGTVGSGVYEVLSKNSDAIAKRIGDKLGVKYVVDIRDLSGLPCESVATSDFSLVLNDPEVSIVVETIGGIGVAQDYTRRALLAGKHVITSNKELVAKFGYELLAIAEEKQVNYLFEAAVGGGIPLIHPLIQCLGANEIESIYGILNGTTNYILTRMEVENVSLAEALKEAQSLGYAEQNPSSDIEGIDSANKIAILSSIACGRHIHPSQVEAEGIIGVTPEDIVAARSLGMSLKLVGRYERLADGSVCTYVAPHFVQSGSRLYSVSDVFNCIEVTGNASGKVAFYGSGAGSIPTASAVAADMLDAACNLNRTIYKGLWSSESSLPIGSDGVSCRRFIRAEGALSSAVEIFGGAKPVSGVSGAAFVVPEMSGTEFKKRFARFQEETLVYAVYSILE